MEPGRAFVFVLAGLVALASLIPLGFIIGVAVSAGPEQVMTLIIRPRIGELLLNTVWLELVTLPLACALGLGLAILTERVAMPWPRLWAALMVAPLAIPAFVQSYAWNSAVPQLHGLWGAVLIALLSYVPFVYLPVAAQLRRLDPALEDAAAALGKSRVQILLRVVLPQLRLPLCGGALLVGLHLLGEYGLFVLMRYDTFATAIVDQFQAVYSGPAANLMGGVLVLCTIALIGLETLLRGDRRYARLGAGAARRADRSAPGTWLVPFLAILVGFALLSTGVTFFTLLRWVIVGGGAIWQWNAIFGALWQSVLLALVGGAVTTLLAVPMAWLTVRAPSWAQRLFEGAHMYTGALPGIIVALSLVALTIKMVPPLYQTAATLVFAYVLMFLPRGLTGLKSSIAQAPIELERAAMSLGRSPLRAVAATTLRLSAPGFAAAMALVALGIANELTATLLLAPNGTRTLATKFWALTSELDYAAAAPYAVLMILLSLPMTILLRRQADRTLSA